MVTEMDLDLANLDDVAEPSQAPAPRASRFQPKSSKLKPKLEPKSEPSSETQPEPPLVTMQEDLKPPINATVETVAEPMVAPEEEEELNDDPIEEDEEDRVVREIDVYFSPAPLDNDAQLYVMQYPLRPCWRPYELEERCKEVRVKPKSSKVEVDLEPVMEQNYDTNVAEKFRMEKETLTSWKPPLTTAYAVGLLKGNNLHLNPVHAVVQLRPSLEHLKSSRSKKNGGTQNVQAEITKEISVESSKKQGGTVRASADAQEITDESWVSLDYHGCDSDFSITYRQKMSFQESSAIQFSMSPGEYLNTLCPALSTEKDTHNKGLSKRLLSSLPIEERFKKWFSEGPQVNRFISLKHLAPGDSDKKILEVIQCHALLVQGLWVSRSKLFNLIGNEALARDYVLLLFKKNTVISNKKLQERRNLQEAMKQCASQFAVYRSSFHDWKFKEPTDMSFIKAHSNVVQKQEKEWEALEKKLMETLLRPTSGTTMRNSSNPATNKQPRTSDTGIPTRVKGPPGSGTVTMPDEAREAMVKALEGLFRKHSVCSWKLICENLREDALLRSSILKPDARGAIAIAREADSLPELQAVISQIARKIHGVYVLKSLGDPTLDPLRNVVIDLFSAKELNAKLRRADVDAAARIKLERAVGTKEYQQVMSQLCVAVKGSAWVLKSGDGNPE